MASSHLNDTDQRLETASVPPIDNHEMSPDDVNANVAAAAAAAVAVAQNESVSSASILGNLIPSSNNVQIPQNFIDNTNDSNSSLQLEKKKKYVCEFCKTASFTRKHNLKSHLLTHTNSKPFSCSYCPSTFRRHYDLKRHEKIHTKEKPFVCLKCGKSFSRADTLLRHTTSNTGCHSPKTSQTKDDKTSISFEETDSNATKKRKSRSKPLSRTKKQKTPVDENGKETPIPNLNDEVNFFAQNIINAQTTKSSGSDEITEIANLINKVVSSSNSQNEDETLSESQSAVLKKALSLLGNFENRLKKSEIEPQRKLETNIETQKETISEIET